MPRESLERVAEAWQKVEVARAAGNEAEIRKAEEELLKAEREHFIRLGVPVVQGRPFVVAAIPVVLIVVLIVTMIFSIKASNSAHATADDLTQASYTNCLVSNSVRTVQVSNLRHDVDDLAGDIAGLRADLDLLRSFPQSTPLLRAELAKRKEIEAKEEAIGHKRQTIGNYVGSVSAVAVRPGSVRADCDGQYPDAQHISAPTTTTEVSH